MIQINLRNPYVTEAPNTYSQVLSHPGGINEAINMASFNDHRYAFYYWAEWSKKKNFSPDLITLDWHQDLCEPWDGLKEELKELNLGSFGQVAAFCWARLCGNNDDHILSAAYLNLIGDIWVVCKQHNFGLDFETEYFNDMYGNTHTIRKFRTPEELVADPEFIKNNQPVYLDIDMDYFTIENNTSNDQQRFTYESDEFVKALVNPASPLMSLFFDRIEGITIALEPDCTGGISNSLHFWSLIEQEWFIWKQENCSRNNWKHLSE